MQKQAWRQSSKEKLEDSSPDFYIQVERAIDEFELLRPATQQVLELTQQLGQRELPHRNVQR